MAAIVAAVGATVALFVPFVFVGQYAKDRGVGSVQAAEPNAEQRVRCALDIYLESFAIPALVEDVVAPINALVKKNDNRLVVELDPALGAMRAAADYDFTENVADGQAIYDLMEAVDRCPKPVVGRINGTAIGGGVGLVSCCDIAVAGDSAQFSLSEVKLGLIPGDGGSYFLSRVVGYPMAMQMILTGEIIVGDEVMRRGLANELVERGQISPWRILLSQFTELMVIILIIAAIVSLALGEVIDTVVIIAIVILNAAIGFSQEYRAEQAMAALRRMASPSARVVRDGGQQTLDAVELVPDSTMRISLGLKKLS